MISNDTLRARPAATEPRAMQDDPLLFVDIDGVTASCGFDSNARPAGAFHNVDGIIHFLSSGAAVHLLALGTRLNLVRCSGTRPRRALAW